MSKGGSSCELSSLDSTRNTSTDNIQFSPKLKGSIIEFKTKTKVISQVVYFISFVLIFSSIIFPWVSTRSDAIKCFNKLFDIGMPNITDFLVRLINGHLNEYQMITNYLASLYEPPEIISVNDESVFELIKFSKFTYNFSLIKPVVVFVCNPGELIYLVFFSDHDFDFYVQYHEGNQTINKKYPSKYNFEKFNHLIDGVFVDSIPGFQDTLIYEKKRWANMIMNFNNNSTSVLTYSLSSSNNAFKVGLAYNIQSLMDIFKGGIPNSNFRYVFMTADGGVLFESQNGLKSPHYNTSHDKYSFPKLNQLEIPFWTAVSQMNYSNFQNEIIFDEMSYLTRYAYILSSNEVTYTFLLVIEKDQLLSKPLYQSAIYFVVLVVIISVICLVSKFIQKKNKERCRDKLNLRDVSLFPQNDEIESYSTLQHCINQIRTLELMYPEEISLNHTLDKIVVTLTEYYPLSNHVKKDNDSLLFSNLNNSRKVPAFTNENCFHHWRSMIHNIFKKKEVEIDENSNLNSNLNSTSNSNLIFTDNLDSARNSKENQTGINFSVDECSTNPSQYLMKTFMKLIFDESLLFQIFDPDIFLKFIFNFSTDICSDCISSSFLLSQLHHIINKYFSNWFNSKFDLLIIFFTSIIYYTKYSDSEFEEEEEEEDSNENNNNNDDDKDSKSDSTSDNKNRKKNRKRRKSSIKKIPNKIEENNENNNNEAKISVLLEMPNSYINGTNFLESKSERRFEFIMNHFIKYFDGIQENEMFIYFQSSVKQIYLLIQDFKMFQLLGKFRVRIESPDFSIFNDINDKYLFFASLIKFCQFGMYYQDMEMMIYLLQNINNLTFSQAERENRLLLADYHFECASKLATYWLNCFTQFIPMKNEKMNLINNTSFLASEKNTMFQEYL